MLINCRIDVIDPKTCYNTFFCETEQPCVKAYIFESPQLYHNVKLVAVVFFHREFASYGCWPKVWSRSHRWDYGWVKCTHAATTKLNLQHPASMVIGIKTGWFSLMQAYDKSVGWEVGFLAPITPVSKHRNQNTITIWIQKFEQDCLKYKDSIYKNIHLKRKCTGGFSFHPTPRKHWKDPKAKAGSLHFEGRDRFLAFDLDLAAAFGSSGSGASSASASGLLVLRGLVRFFSGSSGFSESPSSAFRQALVMSFLTLL